MSASYRFNTLDGMRGIAAIAVMMNHYVRSIFQNSHLAVDLFFCLSGFVIAYSYLDHLQKSMTIKEFVLRRLIRLYPMYFIGISIGALALFGKYFSGQTSLSMHQAINAISLNALYLPYISKSYVNVAGDVSPSLIFPTDPPAWSLFFEMSVNLIFAVIAFRARKLHYLALALLGFIGLLAYYLVTHNVASGWGTTNILGGIPRTIFGFFCGVVLFINFKSYSSFLRAINPIYIIVFLLCFLFVAWPPYIWLASALILVPILIAIGTVSNATNLTTVKIFNYLGWISYPIYCLHMPIYSIFTLITKNQDVGIMAALVCVPIVIGVSHLLATHIEEPARVVLANKLLKPKVA